MSRVQAALLEASSHNIHIRVVGLLILHSGFPCASAHFRQLAKICFGHETNSAQLRNKKPAPPASNKISPAGACCALAKAHRLAQRAIWGLQALPKIVII